MILDHFRDEVGGGSLWKFFGGRWKGGRCEIKVVESSEALRTLRGWLWFLRIFGSLCP